MLGFRREETLKQSLQLLFNNKNLGLIAYIQCIIPVCALHGVHAHFPNASEACILPYQFRLDGGRCQFLNVCHLVLLQFSVLVVLRISGVARIAVLTIYQFAFVVEPHFRLVERVTAWW
ncbi:Hypothetical protein PHPALM_20451 [Phytophthora palmivora]|uniref:Uncharacterized protein n=1 Tax=Phytophthora palmivora TaxID=4796 RepID=A0A2P4XEU1_9STRA|nr:Hypothetical protein PHPALM_20451 [Phytophthora palmivora]